MGNTGTVTISSVRRVSSRSKNNLTEKWAKDIKMAKERVTYNPVKAASKSLLNPRNAN